ncbi:MAG: carbon-nitrogen hydrolase family protein [Catenulispora sp. 13_1_20CM_3_70_7]|nr:MAG: carbon-nitrogen hydrolase family protein [Catenulispora sp. 13_1_20CM_3_70_7]
MRPMTAAALQLAPHPGPLTANSVAENLNRAVELMERCVSATGADLLVLPEAVTTGFTPGIATEDLWDLMSPIPGPATEPVQEAARRLGVHVVHCTYERGAERGVVYNSAVLIGPGGDVLGVYRKTHLFPGETQWVTPGDSVTVVDTELGRIGLTVCFDGDFPELFRIQAVLGAEIICRPSALLRSADIWELTNRARAYDNHVFIIGANATGTDPAGVHYFGNSLIVTPVAEVVARAASHEGWASARLDPATAMRTLTPGSDRAQTFDHLAGRNLKLLSAYQQELSHRRRRG